MTDLESARAAVADLAAASSAVYPGLQWAVVVSRGASGLPELWVTTNEGSGYIPYGVYVPRAMPLAAGLDPDFDTRWFGWSNPGRDGAACGFGAWRCGVGDRYDVACMIAALMSTCAAIRFGGPWLVKARLAEAEAGGDRRSWRCGALQRVWVVI